MELTPHIISHKKRDDEIMRTNVLKAVITAKDSHEVLDGLITVLTKTPRDLQMASTVDFKLIPFQDNAVSWDSNTELIERQKKYLHKTWAISVIDGRMATRFFRQRRTHYITMAPSTSGQWKYKERTITLYLTQ